MYTFFPILDTSDVHTGFWVLAAICGAFMALMVYDVIDGKSGINSVQVILSVICIVVLVLSYKVSYTPNHPINEKVTANFIKFQPEGYREQSGKTKVDRHYVYVIYEVNGQQVLLQGATGITYPLQAILYRN